MEEEAAAGLGGYVLTVLLLIVPVWRIFRRAGFHPALSLLMFLPVIGIPLVVLWLAFLRWPEIVKASP